MCPSTLESDPSIGQLDAHAPSAERDVSGGLKRLLDRLTDRLIFGLSGPFLRSRRKAFVLNGPAPSLETRRRATEPATIEGRQLQSPPAGVVDAPPAWTASSASKSKASEESVSESASERESGCETEASRKRVVGGD